MIHREENFTPISKMRFITPSELDPLTPYTNSTGVYLDSDEDGMPDVVESYLANRSLWGEFGEKFPSLWGEYSWVSSYFWTLYDEDYENNRNATSAMQNATSWLQSQFNPLIKDHTPPVIVKFTIKWDVEGTSIYAKVHTVVRDVGKILVFKVLDEDSGEEVSMEECNSTRVEIEHKFSATIWQAGFGSVHMEVQAIDYAGNEIYVEKELKGAFGQLIDALAKLWSAIWNTLVSVAKAVMDAMNVILEWIEGLFMDAFNRTMESLHALLYSFISLVILDIDGIYKGKITFYRFVRDMISSEIIWIIFGFAVGLTIINYLIMATGIGTVILTAISTALLVVLGFTMVSIGINFVLNPTGNILKDWIRAILNYANGTKKNVRSEGFNETLFEEISWFVLPLFWTVSTLVSEDELLISFAVGLDLVSISLGMVYFAMENYGFNTSEKITVLKGIMGATIGGIFCAGIAGVLAIMESKYLLTIFNIILFAWGIAGLIIEFKTLRELSGGA